LDKAPATAAPVKAAESRAEQAPAVAAVKPPDKPPATAAPVKAAESRAEQAPAVAAVKPPDKPPATASINQGTISSAGNVPQPGDIRFHIVKQGDTINKISKKYNISKIKLQQLNNLPPDFKIKINMKLKLY
jgi:LysM repeat protein